MDIKLQEQVLEIRKGDEWVEQSDAATSGSNPSQ